MEYLLFQHYRAQRYQPEIQEERRALRARQREDFDEKEEEEKEQE
jgi:hypothetical protein